MGLKLVHLICCRGESVKKVMITVEDLIFEFYKRVGEYAGGIAPEQVMSDALFKLAGELSINAIYKKNKADNNDYSKQNVVF